jgi:hypothetical protein
MIRVSDLTCTAKPSPKRWKHLQFKKSNLTLVIKDGIDWLYEIDLERCTNAAEWLDFIYQISSKTWCTPIIIAELLEAFEYACEVIHRGDVQGVFCPCGKFIPNINWKRPGTRHQQRGGSILRQDAKYSGPEGRP